MATAALLGGCGSSAGSKPAGSTERTRSTDPTPPGGLQVPTTYATEESARAAVLAAVAECKHAVKVSTQVSSNDKAELEKACDGGLKMTEPTETRPTTKSVCRELALLAASNNPRAQRRAFADCYAIATK
ncbi:MAG TPA: hypothetical protein VHW67_14160 [Solirubrobacteraceae bacterium]|jgi:hypothetical protein|nr:hypothetical protein [Solirubrobacteraceae bacterium]